MKKESFFDISLRRTARYAVLSCLLSAHAVLGQTSTKQDQMTAVGTTKVWGVVDGISIEGLIQGPTAAQADLQVACVFEYTEGDIFNPPALPAALNGMVHLDEALKGQITELRKTGKFAGHRFETIFIDPPKGTLKAQRLLLIGLGDRREFNEGVMQTVGSVAMREALLVGANSIAFASDIKDAGIDSKTALAAAEVTKGMISANRTQEYLKTKKLSVSKPVKRVILLAGPAFFETAGEGIREAIASFNN